MRMSESASCVHVNLNQADDVHLELLLTNQHDCEPSPNQVRILWMMPAVSHWSECVPVRTILAMTTSQKMLGRTLRVSVYECLRDALSSTILHWLPPKPPLCDLKNFSSLKEKLVAL